jgi:hypothetical protein
MTRKKDDFEKQLEGYLKDSEFAGAFEEETHKLRLALDRAETKGTDKKVVDVPEDLKPVAEVREWRRKMAEGWKGKSQKEIRQELNKAGEDFRKE